MKNIIVLDIETDNVDPLNPKLVGFAIKENKMDIVYCPPGLLAMYRHKLESPAYLKICHNVKFELAYLKSLGINMAPPYYDTMISCWLLGMGKENIESSGAKRFSYSLKNLAELHLGYTEPKTFKQLAKEYPIYTPTGLFKKNGEEKMKKSPGKSSNIPVEVLSEYCKKDVEMTYKLYKLTEPLLAAHDLKQLFYKVEMPLVEIFEQMERNGLLIDSEYLSHFAERLKQNIEQLEEKMNELVKSETTTGSSI